MRPRSIFASRLFRSFAPGALAVLVTCSVAAKAQESDRPRHKDETESSRAAEPRAVVATAPNARLVAVVRAPDGVLVMGKGVERVNRLARGVYCVLPEAGSGIDPMSAVVVVSVEYFYSLYNEVQVQWARKGHGCGDNRIGVYTLADENLDAVYGFSNAVGFVVYVP